MMTAMEKLVKELKKMVPFKDDTELGDIVLILAEEDLSVGYAVVTGIERDPSRRDEWWHLHMQLLSVPMQPMTWTLRTEQFTGQEVFTMGGKARFVKAVRIDRRQPAQPPAPDAGRKGGLRLVK